MADKPTYPQPNHFANPLDRVLAPAAVSRAPFRAPLLPHTVHDMPFNPEAYYPSEHLAKQQLDARSSSVSSTSSATSYSASYSAPHSLYGTNSRSLSPHSTASGNSDPGSGSAIFASSHYQGPIPEQPQVQQPHSASLVSGPPQFLQTQAQVSPSPPMYSSVPTQRQLQQSTPYGYQLASLPQQPSALPFQTYHPVYPPSYSTTSYQSSPALPSYQASQLVHHQSMVVGSQFPREPEEEKESLLLKTLQSLPPDVVRQIQRYVGWFHCWKVSQINRWFRDNFHPSTLPELDKIAGVLYTEQCYGRYDEISSYGSSSRKRNNSNKEPEWFGCYHCFTIKSPEHFERFTWSHTSDEPSSERASPSLSPPQPPSTTPSTTSNPHYCPGLTRSSIAAATSSGHRGSNSDTNTATTNSLGSSSLAPSHQTRERETWGIRRFCIHCGVKKRFYRPGDVIELRKPENAREAVWVCRCWKLHRRPLELHCPDCGSHVPLSTPAGRRR